MCKQSLLLNLWQHVVLFHHIFVHCGWMNVVITYHMQTANSNCFLLFWGFWFCYTIVGTLRHWCLYLLKLQRKWKSRSNQESNILIRSICERTLSCVIVKSSVFSSNFMNVSIEKYLKFRRFYKVADNAATTLICFKNSFHFHHQENMNRSQT